MATDATVILGFISGNASGSISSCQLLGSLSGDDILSIDSTNLTSDDGTSEVSLAHGGFSATEKIVALFSECESSWM